MKRTSLLLGVCLVACSSGASGVAASNGDEPAKSAAARPVIAALKTHDGKVSIRGGGDLRVVVTKDDGTVVADGATLDELRTKDPETWMLVRSSLAQTSGAYLDATLDARTAPTPK